VPAVQVSAAARDAAQLDNSIPREPIFDAARVDALRRAIQNGEYRVDTDRLARAIMQLES
jgi:negative regulator of flagellin synthesis FlgM